MFPPERKADVQKVEFFDKVPKKIATMLGKTTTFQPRDFTDDVPQHVIILTFGNAKKAKQIYDVEICGPEDDERSGNSWPPDRWKSWNFAAAIEYSF